MHVSKPDAEKRMNACIHPCISVRTGGITYPDSHSCQIMIMLTPTGNQRTHDPKHEFQRFDVLQSPPLLNAETTEPKKTETNVLQKNQ